MKSTVTQILQCHCEGALTRTRKRESVDGLSFIPFVLHFYFILCVDISVIKP